MRIFIAGATGEIGRNIAWFLREAGHAVVGLSRRPQNGEILGKLGLEARTASLFDEESLVRAAEGCEAVVHVATAIPFGAPRRRSRYAATDRIRTEGTRCLSRCAGRIGARIYVQQSIVWAGQQPNGEPFDEFSRTHPTWWTKSALDGERIANESASEFGFACATLRCGMFYGPESKHVLAMRRLLRWRLVPILRDCDALKSFIHIEDAARAFVASIKRARSGLWHVVDDRPTSMGAFVQQLARELGTPPPVELPHWAARLVGDVARNAFLDATITNNRKIREDLSWEPLFPTTETGLADIVVRWTPNKPVQPTRACGPGG